jgi:putative ABC transport system permease protein
MTVAAAIRRWQRLTVYTRAQMEEILVDKMIANSARQIGMFLVILSIVSAAIVAFIIYTMTIGKIREIAVLKLIGTRNRTIARHDPATGAGAGPDRLCRGQDRREPSGRRSSRNMCCCCRRIRFAGFLAVMAICTLASLLAIQAAMKVDPAEAIGG